MVHIILHYSATCNEAHIMYLKQDLYDLPAQSPSIHTNSLPRSVQACWLRTFDGCVSPPCPAKLRHTGCQRCWWARPPLPHPVEPSGPQSGCQQTCWHHRCRNEPSRRALSPARLWHHCSPATDVKELLCSMNCFFLLLMCHILKCPTVSTKVCESILIVFMITIQSTMLVNIQCSNTRSPNHQFCTSFSINQCESHLAIQFTYQPFLS